MKTSKCLIWMLTILVLSSSVLGALTDNQWIRYKADEGTGNLLDSINTNGAAKNVTQVGTISNQTGVLGSSRGVYSTTQYFESTNIPTFNSTQNWTVLGMLYHVGSGNWVGNEYLIHLGGDVAPQHGLQMGGSTASFVSLRSKAGTCSDTILLAGTPAANKWYCLVSTYDASTTNFTFWVNGTNVGSDTIPCATGGTQSQKIKVGGQAGYTASENLVSGYADEISIWNRTLTPSEISSACTSLLAGTDPYSPILAPVINNATYNFTSASSGQNSTAWRNGNEAVGIKSLDTTPTITASTVLNANCRIWNQNANWTTMNSSRDCTTTGNTSQVCTLPAADQFTLGSGYNQVYIACIDNATMTNQTPLSTSGALNISLGFTPNISGHQILPSPAYQSSVLNCSFKINDSDSGLFNMSLNWSTGVKVNFTNIANNTLYNSTVSSGYTTGNNVTCNVSISDGETTSNAFSTYRIISNSIPYYFSINTPTENQTVFANWTIITWNCSDIDANDTLTASWYINDTLNGTSINQTSYNLSGLKLDAQYTITGNCSDGTSNIQASSRNFWTNSTVFCSIVLNGLSNDSRYRNNVVPISVVCGSGIGLTSCAVSVNKYAFESFACNASNLTLEMGWNDLVINATNAGGFTETATFRVMAKRLNDAGFAGYITLIILVLAIAALLMAYSNWLHIGAVAVLIGIGGCVLGAAITAFSFWAGGFIIMASVFFMLYEILR